MARFLFTALNPPRGDVAFGGVASWILTVKNHLELLGHDCDVWGPGQPIPKRQYDFGIFANVEKTGFLNKLCQKLVSVCHGIVDEEKPSHNFTTVYTSEEVCTFWGGERRLLPQPINIAYWVPAPNKERRTLLFYSYRASSNLGLNELASDLNLDFVWLKQCLAAQAKEQMQRARLVCASGRAALEAMSCGAPTFIIDDRPYNNGPLVCADLKKAKEHNYSGRGGVNPTFVDLHALAKAAMSEQRPRAYVAQHHAHDAIVQRLLEYLC
ncbi:MAG: hypothetical protein AAF720_00850 [Pseudomonadota bacterium]